MFFILYSRLACCADVSFKFFAISEKKTHTLSQTLSSGYTNFAMHNIIQYV